MLEDILTNQTFCASYTSKPHWSTAYWRDVRTLILILDFTLALAVGLAQLTLIMRDISAALNCEVSVDPVDRQYLWLG